MRCNLHYVDKSFLTNQEESILVKNVNGQFDSRQKIFLVVEVVPKSAQS